MVDLHHYQQLHSFAVSTGIAAGQASSAIMTMTQITFILDPHHPRLLSAAQLTHSGDPDSHERHVLA